MGPGRSSFKRSPATNSRPNTTEAREKKTPPLACSSGQASPLIKTLRVGRSESHMPRKSGTKTLQAIDRSWRPRCLRCGPLPAVKRFVTRPRQDRTARGPRPDSISLDTARELSPVDLTESISSCPRTAHWAEAGGAFSPLFFQKPAREIRVGNPSYQDRYSSSTSGMRRTTHGSVDEPTHPRQDRIRPDQTRPAAKGTTAPETPEALPREKAPARARPWVLIGCKIAFAF